MRIFDWLIECTWQASVLAGLILLVRAIFGKQLSPRWRSNLWLLLVARLLLPVLPESPTSVFNLFQWNRTRGFPYAREQSVEYRSLVTESLPIVKIDRQPLPPDRVGSEISVVPRQGERPIVQSISEEPAPGLWKAWLFYLWLAGVGYNALRLGWTNIRFARRIRNGRRVDDLNLLALFESCRASLQVDDRVLLIETNSVESPCVYGFRKKKILLPAGFVGRFSSAELSHIFSHELAHIHRRDLELSWILAILQAVHWFNPVLWFAFARIRADREVATDTLVMGSAAAQSNEAYGETILKVLSGFSKKTKQPQLIGILESRARVRERVRAIARYGMVRERTGLAFTLVYAVACFALTGAVERPNNFGKLLDIRRTVGRNAPPQVELTRPTMRLKTTARNSPPQVEFTRLAMRLPDH